MGIRAGTAMRCFASLRGRNAHALGSLSIYRLSKIAARVFEIPPPPVTRFCQPYGTLPALRISAAAARTALMMFW